MSRKKTNPHRIPKTKEQAINEARSEGVNLAVAMCMTVLYDKMGFDNDKIADFWEHLEKLSGEVKEGRVNVHDLIRVLREEYSVEIGD